MALACFSPICNQGAKFSRTDEDGAGHTHLGQKTLLCSEWGIRNSPLPLLKERTISLVMVPPWEFKDSCCSFSGDSSEPFLVPGEGEEWDQRMLQLLAAKCVCWSLRSPQLYSPWNCLGSWRKWVPNEYPCPQLHHNEFGINFERNPAFKSYTPCIFLKISYW